MVYSCMILADKLAARWVSHWHRYFRKKWHWKRSWSILIHTFYIAIKVVYFSFYQPYRFWVCYSIVFRFVYANIFTEYWPYRMPWKNHTINIPRLFILWKWYFNHSSFFVSFFYKKLGGIPISTFLILPERNCLNVCLFFDMIRPGHFISYSSFWSYLPNTGHCAALYDSTHAESYDRLRGSHITQYHCGKLLQVGVPLRVLWGYCEGTLQLMHTQ